MRQGTTSDLSIDEVLMLHSVGWEPVDLVFGVSMTSIPFGVWNWGAGSITAASEATTRAAAHAATRMEDECRSAGGHGVVGVEVEVSVHRHHAEVTLVGTAVRPVEAPKAHRREFVSDLSARDFALLSHAGWLPVGLAVGAAYVYAPRRGVRTTMRQAGQNVELTNFTEALYDARESAMERMQSSASALGAQGVVAVHVEEGPMAFAHHAIGFTAWGTAVALGPEGHRRLSPEVAVPMDDAVVSFLATSLRGEGPVPGPRR